MNEEDQIMADLQKQECFDKLVKNLFLAMEESFDKRLKELNNDEIGELFEGFKVIQKWLEDKLFVI